MLTTEEEATLIEAWMATVVRDENGKMVKHDQKLLVQLIDAFQPLVLKFARRYSSYGIDKDELVAVGNLALVETADRFEPAMGFKFSTYSSHWIRGTMLIFIASNYFAFTLKSQKMKHIFFTLRKLLHAEQKEARVSENTEEMMQKMAEHFGCPPAQLQQIYQMIRQPNLSLDGPSSYGSSKDDNPGDNYTLGDMLPSDDLDPEEMSVESSKEKFHQKILYETMNKVLNERERSVIRGQLLEDDDNTRTLQDLADEWQLSRERVRQIRNNAYEKLERAIKRRCAENHVDPRNIF